MSDSNDERLVKIESSLAHLEQLAESLNETVIEQSKALRRLTQQMEQIQERAAAEDMKAAKENITKPPHHGG
ncbi:MAG: SlyX family protein [Verrucomicrobiia bacterium]|jgi:SlyX protein